MNKAYRLVWSERQDRFIAVPEFARSHGKGGECSLLAALISPIRSTWATAWLPWGEALPDAEEISLIMPTEAPLACFSATNLPTVARGPWTMGRCIRATWG